MSKTMVLPLRVCSTRTCSPTGCRRARGDGRVAWREQRLDFGPGIAAPQSSQAVAVPLGRIQNVKMVCERSKMMLRPRTVPVRVLVDLAAA